MMFLTAKNVHIFPEIFKKVLSKRGEINFPRTSRKFYIFSPRTCYLTKTGGFWLGIIHRNRRRIKTPIDPAPGRPSLTHINNLHSHKSLYIYYIYDILSRIYFRNNKVLSKQLLQFLFTVKYGHKNAYDEILYNFYRYRYRFLNENKHNDNSL